MPLVVEDPRLDAGDVPSKPAAGLDGDKHVLDAMEEQDRHANLSEVESPRPDEREVVVEPPFHSVAERLGEALAEELLQLREDRLVGWREQRLEAALLTAQHRRGFLVEEGTQDVFSVKCCAEFDDVPLSHAVEPVE